MVSSPAIVLERDARPPEPPSPAPSAPSPSVPPPPVPPVDVAALVHAAANGDAMAWEGLVERFSGLVWSIARGYRLNGSDAADVSQVVWLRLLEQLDKIRQPERLGAWLAAVTRHECLRLHRRSQREVLTEDDLELDTSHGSAEDEVDQRLFDDDRAAALWRAFETLPVRWQAMLRILMSSRSSRYEEVSAALGVPIGSIGPTRQRCLERLRASPELKAVALTS